MVYRASDLFFSLQNWQMKKNWWIEVELVDRSVIPIWLIHFLNLISMIPYSMNSTTEEMQ